MPDLILKLEAASVDIEERTILRLIDLEISRGERVVLLGSNGAGKSTLIRLIMGEIGLSHGAISVSQRALIAQDPRQSTYSDLTIAEHCRLKTTRDCRAYLADFLPQLAKRANQPVGLLSGGERQVLALALCLIDPPDLLLLDEHTSALDPKTADRIMDMSVEMCQSFGVATLITTHNLEHARKYGKRIVGLRRGQISHDGVFTSLNALIQLCYD